MAILVSEPLLLVILGPTGSGKTDLSLAVGQHFAAEIVSCDSVAVYRGLEIGSAKPSSEQRSRLAHHLLDVVAPDAVYTAGDYARAAREAIAGITLRGRLPIVTGGTGLYLRALLQGLSPSPQRSAALRERLLRKPPLTLHRILGRLDPASAARIHANDVAKVIRAIEVSLTAGQPMSEVWRQRGKALTGYRILRIGLDPPRLQLYERINRRAAEMFAGGLVEETQALLTRYGRTPALASLGYRQAIAYLDSGLTLEQAVAAASQGHRNYAKRQLTWFRREPDVCWLAGFGDDCAVQHDLLSQVQSVLSGRESRDPKDESQRG